MTFWLVAFALSAAIVVPIAVSLLRARAAEAEMQAFDVQIYRDQLSAVDKDLARGIVTEDEAERLRTEIKRRILDADRAHRRAGGTGQAPEGLTVAAAFVSGIVVIGGSFALYQGLGAPGYPDLPLAGRIEAAEIARATRPTQLEAEASVPRLPPSNATPEFLDLMEQLRTAVTDRPGDLQGLLLLARNEAALGNFAAAYAAQAQIIETKGEDAVARDFADYGDLLVLAAGGYVSPEAEAAFAEALTRDPTNGAALYYMGVMHLQTGRPDQAFNIWEAQLRRGPAGAPWIGPIRAQIAQAAARAGVDYVLPPLTPDSGLGGPSAADVSAAEDMSPLERMEMIEGMVTGLSQRLATEGGPPEEWARLIRAYGVLGRRDAAAAIWAEAQNVFVDEVAIIPILRAARDAGVAP
ncbi:MAG: c-type cytochrome biogenesis protein CcmI [Pseudomonadota bacterium]